MQESILETIRGMIGPSVSGTYTAFDNELIIHINSVLMILYQAGIGQKGFQIRGTTETWYDFLGETSDLEAVKSYVYLRVKLLFDPPTSSFVLDSMQKQSDEMLWRLNVIVDPES